MKAAWAQCSWQWRVVFTSKKNSSPWDAKYSGPMPKLMPGAEPPLVKLPAGGHWGGAVERGGTFVYCGADKREVAPLKALPPGKYTLVATYSYLDPKRKEYWRGSVSTAPVEVEIGGAGAALRPKGGDVVNGLSLRLTAVKSRYGEKEPLKLRVFLDNVGDKQLTVLKRTSHVDLGFNARDAEGRFIVSLLPPAPPRPLRAADLAPLAPGASLELENWELLARVNNQIAAGKGRTGKFTVTAWYHAQSEGKVWNVLALDPKAWTGRLKSNPVKVEVTAGEPGN
jgi:hypothetical protein